MDSNRNCFVCKRTFQIFTSLNNDYNESSKKGNQEQCKIFYSVVCRYLNLVDFFSSTDNNPKNTLKPSESNLIENDSLSCCDICVPLIKSFSDTYNQWKILQLALNWKLETITKLMSLKAENHDSQGLGWKGEMFRKALLDKVEDKSIQFPRLKLEKLEIQDSTFPAPPDPLETLEISKFENDDVVSELHDDDEPPFHESQIDIKYENVSESDQIKQDNNRKAKEKPILISKVSTSAGAGKYDCKLCGKSFAYPSAVINHLRVHTGEKPYPCDYCDARFSRRSNWTRHVGIHKNLKFKCRYCKAKFASKYYLDFHESVHLGKAKFRCRFCGHGFHSNVMRKDHENSHIGRKPYTCRYCSKAFAHKPAAMRHEKSQTPRNKNVASEATGSQLQTTTTSST